MVEQGDGYARAGEVLDGVGGPLLPLPGGRVGQVYAVVRQGKLTRVEVLVYNQGRRANGEGRAKPAR